MHPKGQRRGAVAFKLPLMERQIADIIAVETNEPAITPDGDDWTSLGGWGTARGTKTRLGARRSGTRTSVAPVAPLTGRARKKSLISYSCIEAKCPALPGPVNAAPATRTQAPAASFLYVSPGRLHEDAARPGRRSRVMVAIGESIGGIQHRRPVHPLQCRRKASDVLERGEAHRSIHVYGSWSICRDRRWKLSGISFNPPVETSSTAAATPPPSRCHRESQISFCERILRP